MTTERMAELRKLIAAATEGPWRAIRHGVWAPDDDDVADAYPVVDGMGDVEPHDCALIAAARQALPEALDEIERARDHLAIVEADRTRLAELAQVALDEVPALAAALNAAYDEIERLRKLLPDAR